MSATRALVLGGGGVTGIAWELGVASALAEAGVDLGSADLVVGTSAGATVGAQLTSGTPLRALGASQLTPAGDTKERAVDLDFDALAEIFEALFDNDADAVEQRAKVGAMAREAQTIPASERHEIIAARLSNAHWPETRLVITAVDAVSGEFHAFDADSGVALVDAVAASSAVPGVWPPAPVGDRLFIDGGVRSATNADLAAGHDTVLILSPMAAAMTPRLDRSEVVELEAAGSVVVVLRADDHALADMGANPLDPAMRAPALAAGQRQGQAAAADLAEIWTGGLDVPQ